jgi:glycosyltransferase involved in cell wall biosynthesis
MKLTITDDVEDVEGIDVADLSDVASSDEDIPSFATNELSKEAMGGSELMAKALQQRLDPELAENFQFILSRVREVSKDKKHPILWCHDLAQDPEAAHLAEESSRNRFKKLVFVSNWQLQMYNLVLGVPYSQSHVLFNAIDPFPQFEKKYDGTINLIYHTTPHRGLALLVPVFEHLAKTLPFIHLDVYSSFNIYGWPQRDEQYADLFKRVEDHPQMTYHGSVPNEEVREALVKSHIFAYPSIWPETSCIAAIEALAAKNIMVAPNYAALPETAARWGWMYQWDEDANAHANEFASNLHSAIMTMKNAYENIEGTGQQLLAHLDHQKNYYDVFYSWDARIIEWTTLLKKILEDNVIIRS